MNAADRLLCDFECLCLSVERADVLVKLLSAFPIVWPYVDVCAAPIQAYGAMQDEVVERLANCVDFSPVPRTRVIPLPQPLKPDVEVQVTCLD